MEVLDPSFECTLIKFPCLAPDRHIPPLPLPRCGVQKISID